MSGIREAVDEYLTIRRRLGYKLIGAGSLLSDFAFYCERMGVATLSTEAMLAWVKQPANCQPVWWSIRMGTAWLQRLHVLFFIEIASRVPTNRDRVRPRGPVRRPQDLHPLGAEDVIEAGGELEVAFAE